MYTTWCWITTAIPIVISNINTTVLGDVHVICNNVHACTCTCVHATNSIIYVYICMLNATWKQNKKKWQTWGEVPWPCLVHCLWLGHSLICVGGQSRRKSFQQSNDIHPELVALQSTAGIQEIHCSHVQTLPQGICTIIIQEHIHMRVFMNQAFL